MEVDAPSAGPSESQVAEAQSASPGPGQMFHNATGFGIHGGQFMSVQGNVNIQPMAPYPMALTTPQAPQTMAPIVPSVQTTVYSESGNYSNQLLRQGRGFAVYSPKPQRNLAPEYRRKGVSIGDVGTITPQGTFDYFFNIYLPADNPINAHIPDNFVPLPPYLAMEVIEEEFDPGDYVSSPSIHEINDGFSESVPGGEFVFSCRGPNGAVLALPYGSHLEKLQSIAEMRRYARKHAGSWYKHVNETRGRALVNGSLYLITGCEKAESWGIATFHDVPGPNEFQLSFAPTTDVDHGHRYRWHAPYCRHKHADSPAVDGTPLNQTIFIHAFAISLGETLWGTLFGDVEICQLADPSTFPEKSGRGFVPYASQGSSFVWSFFRDSATGGGKQRSGETPALGNTIISDASPIPQVFHPSQIIHEHIRREAPEAAVVITHDDDWRDVFREDATGKNRSELQQAIFDRFEITEEEGAVFLRTKFESRELKPEAITLTPEVDLGDKPPPKETENCLDVSSAEELIVLNMNSIGLPSEAPSRNEKPAPQEISAQKHDGRSFQAEEESIKRDSSPLDELPIQLASGSMTVTPLLHVPAVLAVALQGSSLPIQAQFDTEDGTKAPPTNFVPLSARSAAPGKSLQRKRPSWSYGPISPVDETPTKARQQQPSMDPSSRSNIDPQSRSSVVSTQSQSALLSPFDNLSIQDKASDQQSQYSDSDTQQKFWWDLYEHAPGPDGRGSDADYNPGVHSHGDGGRQAARAHRRRQARPYSLAAPAPRPWSNTTTLVAESVAGGNWTEDDSILGAPHSTSTQKSTGKGNMKTSANKDATTRKPGLTCLFCRGRKIACTPWMGWSCHQCLRRGLVCEYPAESRRGMRKKKVLGGSPSAVNAGTAPAGVEMDESPMVSPSEHLPVANEGS